jgi:hypothetical protein
VKLLGRRHPIVALEDPFAEDDRDGWELPDGCLGDRVQPVGDDVFAASPALVRRGIEERVANAVVIKPNQVGTLSETLRAIAIAREAGVGSDRLASFWRDRGHHDRGPRGRRAGGADQGWRPVPRRADCQVQPFAADRRGGGG